MANMIELTEAPLVETPVEGSTLFCLNPDGTINRVSAANVGGSGGIKTIIIKDNSYDAMIDFLVNGTEYTDPETITYECINMTYEEADQAIKNGEPLNALYMTGTEGASYVPMIIMAIPDAIMLTESFSMKIKLQFTSSGVIRRN